MKRSDPGDTNIWQTSTTGKLEIASLDMGKKRQVKKLASVSKTFLLSLLINKVWGQENHWKKKKANNI